MSFWSELKLWPILRPLEAYEFLAPFACHFARLRRAGAKTTTKTPCRWPTGEIGQAKLGRSEQARQTSQGVI